jgi:hypothetical protein
VDCLGDKVFCGAHLCAAENVASQRALTTRRTKFRTLTGLRRKVPCRCLTRWSDRDVMALAHPHLLICYITREPFLAQPGSAASVFARSSQYFRCQLKLRGHPVEDSTGFISLVRLAAEALRDGVRTAQPAFRDDAGFPRLSRRRVLLSGMCCNSKMLPHAKMRLKNVEDTDQTSIMVNRSR